MNGEDLRAARIDVGDWELAVERFDPPGAPVGVVLAGHAMLCDRRTLDRPRGSGLASTLAAAGLLVYTFDTRGHGDSPPTAAQGATWSYRDLVETDLPALVSAITRRHPDLPLALLGHSLVGHAALFALGRRDLPVSAVVTFAAGTWLRRFEPRRPRWWLKRGIVRVWGGVTGLVGHFPARALGVGTADEATAYVRDFSRWAAEDTVAYGAEDYVAGLSRVRPPVLAWVGDRDWLMCHPDCARRFLSAVPRHELRVVPGDHMDIVTSPKGRPLWQETAAWLRARFGA